MLTLRVVTVTLVLVIATAIGVAGQEEEASPSAPAAPIPESATPAPTWLNEQTCIDPDFMMPQSSSGTTVGYQYNCTRSLGLKKGDPDFDAYDFFLMKRTVSKERYTEQCDDTGNLIGSRYHAFGSDRLHNSKKPERVAEGTFDISVVSTLLDPDEDIWQVEEQGVLWDVHAADGDWSWTWSVEARSAFPPSRAQAPQAP